jgi:hypothetical protein
MEINQILSIVIGVAVAIAIAAIVVWPEVRKMLTMRSGYDTTAIVKSIRLTSTRDETHKRLYALTLEVRSSDQPLYVVNLTQAMPWMHGPGMPGGEIRIRVHPSFRNWVVVVPPDRSRT